MMCPRHEGTLLEIVGLSEVYPSVRPYTQRINVLWSGHDVHYTQTERVEDNPLGLWASQVYALCIETIGQPRESSKKNES